MGQYCVVFEGTEKAGAYEGIRTWTSFESREHFQEWWHNDESAELRERERIFEEGVSPDRCVELCNQTPQGCRERVVLHDIADELGHLAEKIRS